MVRPACSRELDDPNGRPYFAWDEPVTVADVRRQIAAGGGDERVRWIARLLRNARFDDV